MEMNKGIQFDQRQNALTIALGPEYAELFYVVSTFSEALVPCCVQQPTFPVHQQRLVLKVMFCEQADEFLG